jgi:iron-sulfur cluster repair protein YtfE (RIC family)
MSSETIGHGQGETPFGPEDFREPIEFLYGVHERLRRHCEHLIGLAGDPDAAGASEVAATVLDFLESELPLHRADEEEDLFPLLERRSPVPETGAHDELLSALEVLRQEHRDDIEQGHSLFASLRLIAEGETPRDPEMFRHYVHAFVKLQRGHQTMENRVVLPAAFERLTPEDLAELGRKMAARRGLLFAG